MSHYKFRLFVSGQLGNSLNAVSNLKALGGQLLGGDYDLEIIDVLENPELAELEKISATPTLIKDSPLPVRRLVGDLSHTPRVLAGLGISPRAMETQMSVISSKEKPDER